MPGPERTCVATRTRHARDGLIRFVVAPDGSLVPDLKGRLPGRGVYVGASAAAVAEAVRRKAFQRSLKTEVRVAPDLPDLCDTLLARDALQALALANKAGGVVTGSAKIEGAAGRVVALIHACEAAPDGRRKLEGALKRRAGGESPPLVPDEFTTEQLSLSLGREHVVHAALIAHAASTYALERIEALRRFRGRGVSPPAALPVDDARTPSPPVPTEDRELDE